MMYVRVGLILFLASPAFAAATNPSDSLQSLIQSMPKDLQPAPGEGAIRSDARKSWLASNIVGKSISESLKVAVVRRSGEFYLIEMETTSVNWIGADTLAVTFKIPINDPRVKGLQQLKRGDTTTLAGTIEDIVINPALTGKNPGSVFHVTVDVNSN
jgi:hypothetical protein